MAVLPSGDGFVVFGGFVNGCRVNDVIVFKFDGAVLHAEMIGDATLSPAPKVRSGMSIGIDGDKLFVFGGQDDDSNKMADMWEFNMETHTWA